MGLFLKPVIRRENRRGWGVRLGQGLDGISSHGGPEPWTLETLCLSFLLRPLDLDNLL